MNPILKMILGEPRCCPPVMRSRMLVEDRIKMISEGLSARYPGLAYLYTVPVQQQIQRWVWDEGRARDVEAWVRGEDG